MGEFGPGEEGGVEGRVDMEGGEGGEIEGIGDSLRVRGSRW